jgi:hypothetical protein
MRPPPNRNLPYYAYCILRLEADREWNVFPGISDRPVFPLREGRLAMLVSRVDSAVAGEAQSLIEHGRVIRRVFEQHTVLPFRFGTVFATEQHARQLLISNRSDLQEALNRLRGKAEMHLKMVFENALGNQPGSGGRRGEGGTPPPEALRLAADRLAGIFQTMGEHVSVRELQNGECLVDLAHLIEDSRVASYQRVFQHAADRMKDCQLLVSGPWPPYHFLPSAVRLPPASATQLRPGRRAATRRPFILPQARAAKA